MTIDDPAVLAEVTALVERYEAALAANDIETLDAMFWRSEKVIRFGVGERLYGTAEILAFRRGRAGGSPPREVLRTDITTFGRDHAVANLAFRRTGGTIGRQSQTWVRLPEGWRIVSAHVSLEGAGH
ncbi:MAG: oxalurate catabolism protein HpxZ [Sphingomonas fennica]